MQGGQAPKTTLAIFDFSSGTLTLTEASPKKRASLYLVHGEAALEEHDPGGIDVFTTTRDEFAARLKQENRTLKRALTDPRLFSGIGNAYSDEILHEARLSPTQLTSNLTDRQTERVFECVKVVLRTWTARLIEETGDRFPEKVTAFRAGMAVHGKFGQPCPRCGAPVQRIQYAANECNYCAPCQTGGRLLADRGLSRLLGKDWPRSLEELEELKRRDDLSFASLLASSPRHLSTRAAHHSVTHAHTRASPLTRTCLRTRTLRLAPVGQGRSCARGGRGSASRSGGLTRSR